MINFYEYNFNECSFPFNFRITVWLQSKHRFCFYIMLIKDEHNHFMFTFIQHDLVFNSRQHCSLYRHDLWNLLQTVQIILIEKWGRRSIKFRFPRVSFLIVPTCHPYMVQLVLPKTSIWTSSVHLQHWMIITTTTRHTTSKIMKKTIGLVHYYWYWKLRLWYW